MMNILTRKSMLLPAILLLVVSLLIVQLPLLNYLGFEFSVAIALLVPVILGLFVLSEFRKDFPQDRPIESAHYSQTILRSLIRALALLLIPFVVASLNAFFVRNCSYGEGILYFLLIPVVTAVWTVTAAAWCFVLFRRYRLAYALMMILVLLHPIYLGYVSPQIYSYNLIFGYFPGFSYDEVLTITPTLVEFRLVTLMMAIWFTMTSLIVVKDQLMARSLFVRASSLFRHIGRDGLRWGILFATLVLSLAWIYRVPLGFESSTERLKDILSSEYTTEHFEIHYAAESFSSEDIRWLAAEHEFRFHEVDSALQIHFDGKIASFIYPNQDVKREVIGTSSTNIAKPWRREIHLDKDSWQATLKHELVHVMAGTFGLAIIKAHYHIGLVEGLAMAIDPVFGNRTLNQYAAAIKVFGLVKDPGQLITPLGFATRASTVSYVLMGSFCSYLLDRYGMMRYKELYGGRTVERVYGKSYDELVAEWQAWLDRVEVPKQWRKHVEYFFRRPSIFAKECARTVANLNDMGFRLLDQKESQAAMSAFTHALSTSWNTESYAGLVRAAFDAAKYDTVAQLIGSRVRDSSAHASFVNLFIVYGDALWNDHDSAQAREVYNEVTSLDLSDRYNESAAIRLTALEDDTLRAILPAYFSGSLTDSSAERMLEDLRHRSSSPLLAYLNARLEFRQKKYSQVIASLESIHTRFQRAVLNAGKEQLLGQSYFYREEFEQARIHFWESMNFLSNEASARRITDWLKKCEWYESNARSMLHKAEQQE